MPVGSRAPAPRATLLFLFLVGVVNLMDRHILAILLEPIKQELGVSDGALGFLTGFAFVGFYSLASLPLARLADGSSRRTLVVVALAVWSCCTGLGGLAVSFVPLALARVGVGIGEAATGPAGHSMVSDLFPQHRRAGALSVLAVSAPVGAMAALILGGVLNEAVGWRFTLMAMAVPGLVLALVGSFVLQEPVRGGTEDGLADTRAYSFGSTLRYLWERPSYRLAAGGAALAMLAVWSVMTWGPAFLMRVHGLGSATAGAWLGLVAGVGGAAGTLLGGLLAQRMARRDPRWLLRVPAVAALLAAPFLVLFVLSANAGVSLVTVFAGLPLAGAMLGPVMTVTQGIARVRMRAVAAAVVTLTFNFVGVGCGPLLVGVTSDLLLPVVGSDSIRYGLLIPAASVVGAAACFAAGARHLQRDLAGGADHDPVPAAAERLSLLGTAHTSHS